MYGIGVVQEYDDTRAIVLSPTGSSDIFDRHKLKEMTEKTDKVNERQNDFMKPCPFCGTPAKLHSEETIYGPDRPGWYVQCGSSLCWAQTRSFGVKEQAIRTWNKRVKE